MGIKLRSPGSGRLAWRMLSGSVPLSIHTDTQRQDRLTESYLMKNVFSHRGRALCLEWLRQSPLLAFDFDGTLAPIVSDPSAARLADSTSALLAELAQRRCCIVVSGRSRKDVKQRLGGIPLAEVVGNHGSEPWLSSEVYAKEVSARLAPLRGALAACSGVVIEDKGMSISVHYRHAIDRRGIIQATYSAARSLGFEHIVAGKYVLNLIPKGGMTKGSGLMRAMCELQRTRAIYVGDDVTDESIFQLSTEKNILGIKVGHLRKSAATLYLKKQSNIDTLLYLLLSQ